MTSSVFAFFFFCGGATLFACARGTKREREREREREEGRRERNEGKRRDKTGKDIKRREKPSAGRYTFVYTGRITREQPRTMPDDTVKLVLLSTVEDDTKSALVSQFIYGNYVEMVDVLTADSYQKQLEIDGEQYMVEILYTPGINWTHKSVPAPLFDPFRSHTVIRLKKQDLGPWFRR
jgi:hypothetical protein